MCKKPSFSYLILCYVMFTVYPHNCKKKLIRSWLTYFSVITTRNNKTVLHNTNAPNLVPNTQSNFRSSLLHYRLIRIYLTRTFRIRTTTFTNESSPVFFFYNSKWLSNIVRVIFVRNDRLFR